MKTFLSVICFVVSFLSLTTGPAFAQEKKSTDATKDQAAIPIKPIESTLPNGLKLIVVEDKRELKVHLKLCFQTTYDENQKETLPLYALVQQLISKGTTTLSAQQFDAELKKLNADFRSEFQMDYLMFSGFALSNNTKDFIRLFADVSINPSFAESELQALKDAANKRTSSEVEIARFKIREGLFGKHPYAYPTTEYSKQIEAITRDKLIAFHKKAIVPNNALLVVFGNVKASDISKYVSDLFGKWTSETNTKKQLATPQARTENALYVIDAPNSTTSDAHIGFVGPDFASQDYFPMSLIQVYLSTKGQFHRETHYRLANELVYEIPTKQTNAKEAINLFFSKIDTLKTKPLSDSELKGLKESLVKGLSLHSSPNVIAELLALGVSLDFQSKINAVTAADVQRVAKQYLDTNKAVIVVAGDASVLLDQLKPLAKNVEVFDGKGNKKELTATTTTNNSTSTEIFEGVWNLDINFQGSPIKATLDLKKHENVYNGTVKSDLGDGQLSNGTATGNTFEGTISLNMYGQPLEIKVKGVVENDKMKGTLTPNMQGVRDLPFTGTKAK
jgi:predicted Zn-dependent peptidase